MCDFPHSNQPEDFGLYGHFQDLYQHDKECFRKKCHTPAAVEARYAANRFIVRYGLSEIPLEFALMERPKGTVILDENWRTVMSQKYKDKKLTLGRRCAVYFHLPVEIPSLGLQANQLIGFVGDRKVLNSAVTTNYYLLCVPHTLKEWRLIGVVRRDTGEADMSISTVVEVVTNIEDENKKTRPYIPKSGTGDGMSKKRRKNQKKKEDPNPRAETVNERTDVEPEGSSQLSVESPDDGEASEQFQNTAVSDVQEDQGFPSFQHSPVMETYDNPVDEPQYLEGNYPRLFSSSGSLCLPAPDLYYPFEVKARLSSGQEEYEGSEKESEYDSVLKGVEPF